jgi:uncharacterized protein
VTLKIKNRDARALWLSSQGLSSPPTGTLDVVGIIKRLGYVQLDTIQVVARAHHHIMWNRNQHYREPMLDRLLAEDRSLFEHFTHDASVLPMEFYPMWRRQFARLKAKRERSKYFSAVPGAAARESIRQRIADEGPLSTHAFDTKAAQPGKMWSRPPHKLALDYMWYAGELATSHRVNFNKYYDLSERVIPADIRGRDHAGETQIDWLCAAALDRLGFAAPGEIQRFWEAVDAAEVKTWIARAGASVVPVEIETADGSWSKALAAADIGARLVETGPPTSRLRILNPFDPAIRDRTRLKRLFGFDYRVEMFVPAAKRQWGYYVYPLLEGDRFVGRLEAKADRGKSVLNVLNVWLEPGVKWTGARATKLEAELARFARLASVDNVIWIGSRTPRG